MLPESAAPYWEEQAAINAATVALAVQLWERSRGDERRWESAIPTLVAAVIRAQWRAVALAARFVSAALRDQGLPDSPAAVIIPDPLIGVTGAGIPLDVAYRALPAIASEFAETRRQAATSVGEVPDLATRQVSRLDAADLAASAVREVSRPRVRVTDSAEADGLRVAESRLRLVVQSTISDTGRAAESLEIAVRPQVGYVRMLNPPSCARCVVLAGKFYRWSQGFERHPQCDCRHIPVAESTANDVAVDPTVYFNSLDEAAQNKTFTRAGAQAIRDGADISQVVNAHKDVSVAQVYGRRLEATTQGTTARGRAGRAIRARGRNPETSPRLMPTSIYQIADDRADALRLLQANGYIADDASVVDLDALTASA